MGAVCLALFALNGCAHYQLGTEGKLSFHKLYVEPVENRAGIPQAVAVVSTQLREAFLHDSRVTLVSNPDQAEAILKVTLVHYGRAVTTVLPGDTGLARKFDISLGAQCTLKDNQTQKLLFEKRGISVTRQIFTTAAPPPPSQLSVDSNQLQAEYDVLPLLASSLADRVTHAVLDVW